MTDDRLALLVRAAIRGIMEALLAIEEPPLPPAVVNAFGKSGRVEPVSDPDELEFPSVSRIEQDIFGETPPPTIGSLSEDQVMAAKDRKADLDRAVAEMTRIRERQEQSTQPQYQPGPGEKEVADWLRIPQA